ncbi:glutamyl-tRNA(Gln) amidotransferase subunit C, mitochondrial-like [Varroa jacobsoni]|uniref:glutamyl-tRNA(Gln) amidotransferase subunit C, mitochondrial-like n=1 Tax=Varroa jacobsoni TaxID=62625 RepID=UPI000BF33897|nr:glutamyl-tRNA(Gln) amidotransferase subunit C, mitochondrial-like [Varroa jacobsoni]
MAGFRSVLCRAMSSRARDCIPKAPVYRALQPRERVTIPVETAHILEKLSLVRFGEVEAVKKVEEAATFAQAIFDVDTTGIEPMYTILEDRSVELREDVPEECDPNLVLNNVTVMEEGYIVAPLANIFAEENENINNFETEK